MLHHLDTHGTGEKHLQLHADNCMGQKKTVFPVKRGTGTLLPLIFLNHLMLFMIACGLTWHRQRRGSRISSTILHMRARELSETTLCQTHLKHFHLKDMLSRTFQRQTFQRWRIPHMHADCICHPRRSSLQTLYVHSRQLHMSLTVNHVYCFVGALKLARANTRLATYNKGM